MFRNRMFPTKAVRIWQQTADEERPALVVAYLQTAGGFGDPLVETPLPPRQGRWFGGDPLWVVVARRDDGPVEPRR